MRVRIDGMSSSNQYPLIAMIGAGNMARAIIGGLIACGHPAGRLVAADPDTKTRRAVFSEYEIATHAENRQAVAGADVVVLAVKPQVIDTVTEAIARALPDDCVVVSVAAGIPVARLRQGVGADRAVVRVMPNTPALHGAGATGMYAAGCSEKQVQTVRTLFEAVGKVFEIADETLMDAVTAVSGSGPAYFFALAEALAAAGHAAGLDGETAEGLATQTATGSGVMLGTGEATAAELRQRVTSPGGTTAAALEALEKHEFSRIVRAAVDAALQRGRELGGKTTPGDNGGNS